MSSISRHQFSVFRIVFALYLAIFFFLNIQWVPDIIITADSIVGGKGSPISSVFANVLNLLPEQSPLIQFFTLLCGLLSVLLLLGYNRRWLSLFLAYGWVCHLDYYSFKPQFAFASALFVFFVLIYLKKGEPWSRARSDDHWQIKKSLPLIAMILLVLGFTLDGVSAVRVYLNSKAPVYDPSLALLIAPLYFFKPSRKVIWSLLIITQLLVTLKSENAGLASANILLLLFCFDRNWFAPKVISGEKPILFFDGVCGLCNSFIDFLFIEDDGKVYNVAALQGETAKEKLSPERITDLNTLVVLEDGVEKTKSDAVLSIAFNIGGIWRLLSYTRVLPRTFRDWCYDQVANHRYSFFGKKESCRIATPDEKARFLA